MALMEWNDRLSVGVREFDDEHRHLVAMLNELSDAMQAGHGNEALGTILDELIEYTATHFAHEEADMDRYGYPHAEEHKRIHQELVAEVLEIKGKFDEGASATLSFEVLSFLKGWLLEHISQTDKKLGQFLLEHGQAKAS
jgi:hemerythrin